MDLLDLFERSTDWTASKIPGATPKLGNPTRCDEWSVRDLLNHMIDTQRFFTERARGEEAALPYPDPPDVIGDDPVGAYKNATEETLSVHREPGVLEKTGPGLGIAFCDQLIHGADLANATGQDDTMPDDLAQAAFGMLDGRLTDDQRGTGFKPAVKVDAGASAQDKLLAFTGRQP